MKKALLPQFNFSLILKFLSLVLLTGCSQSYLLTLNPNDKMGGKVEAQLELKPLFTRYLQDLDLFMGANLSPDQLPQTLDSLLSEIFVGSTEAYKKTRYNANEGSFKVDYGFSFRNLQTFLQEEGGFLSNLIEITNNDTEQAVAINYNLKKRELLQTLYPLLPPISNISSQASYKDQLINTLASTKNEQTQAANEIGSSTITLILQTPRPIKQLIGGTKQTDNKAVFTFNLLDLLYPTTNLNYKIVY